MDGQTETPNENQDSPIEITNWADAFAAFDKAHSEDSEGTTGEQQTLAGNLDSGREETDTTSKSDDFNTSTPDAQMADSGIDASNAGGLDHTTGENSQQAGESGSDLLGISDEEIQSYRDGLNESIRNRAINEMAQEFIKRGIRHTNGKLGASIEDKDICKRDSDGVPHFYNPDTGREFTGDNPRRQAQEWCEDYNKELANAFNQACASRENQLMQTEAPQLAVLEFASEYDKLDPIRKGMFEQLISDYEIADEGGDVVAYSCDLHKALAAVNRQVEMIQGYAKANVSTQQEKPSGPVLDMKNSAGAAAKPDEKPKFNSLAEAMEWEQDRILSERKGK